MLTYIPLCIYSQFTIEESIIDIETLVQKAHAYRFSAIGIGDKANLFGLITFYKTCLKYKIKPLVGSYLHFKTDKGQMLSAFCYAKNYQGYQDLCALISASYKCSTAPVINLELLKQYNSDLILILCQQSLESYLRLSLQERLLFPKECCIGIERYKNHPQSLKESYTILDKARDAGLIPVIGNKVFFLNSDDYQIQQVKFCIQKGFYLQDEKRPVDHHPYHYLHSPADINELFFDVPDLIENTNIFAQKCTLVLPMNRVLLPKFADDENALIRKESFIGLEKRKSYGALHTYSFDLYINRLNYELDMIAHMGFSGYFLIVSDFIGWAKKNNIPVGPGRGSGVGSLVAYALEITDVNPLLYGLLFERFLNPERVSLPDFDVDFCMDRRDEVISYVEQRYGSDYVSQIATFGTMAAKAVIRDVGRVLSQPFPFVDRIAKLIPMQVGISLEESLEQEPAFKSLYEDDESVRHLVDIALKLEGKPRNIGKHAGGVVISPVPLQNICPLYSEIGAPWQPVTQLDKDDIEVLGLIKFDFLGLKTLTVIQETYHQALKIDLPLPPLHQLPINDRRCYEILSLGETIGVFQLESKGFRDLIKRVKPDSFEDIIALVALYRPGPLQSGMVDDFIARKHGDKEIIYPHRSLEEILKPTYGIILYQEQVMQIAQVLGGYSLGSADLLRRAMGKKKPEEMAQQRAIFVQGALAKGVDSEVAEPLFDLMEKFSGYGFNKSHAAAYALIAYQTLYLKVYAPAPFFAATMSADKAQIEKMPIFSVELDALKIQLSPPCVQKSYGPFTALSEKEIIYGLYAIKGLGEAIVDEIVRERLASGLFDSFDQFVFRMIPAHLTKKHVELLVLAGAFDILDPNRSLLFEQIQIVWTKNLHRLKGQCDLFDFSQTEDLQQTSHQKLSIQLWSQRLILQKQILGLSFGGNLFDPYRFGLRTLWEDSFQNNPQPVLATLLGMRRIMSQKGQPLCCHTWMFCNGQKSDFYLNYQKEQDLEVIAFLEKCDLSIPYLLFCEQLKATENRRSRLIIKEIVGVNEFLETRYARIELVFKDYTSVESLTFLKFVSQFAYTLDLEIGVLQHDGLKEKFHYQPTQQDDLPIHHLIESAFIYRAQVSIAFY